MAKSSFNILFQHYGPQACFLKHRNAFELLIAVILSAQCTDNVVNAQTPLLFDAFPTPEALAKAPLEKVENLIRKIGLYHAKAKYIITCSQTLCEKFNGIVPSTIEALLTLQGVGRKTANVVIADVYQIPGLAVDTHVKRLSFRLGLTRSIQPEVIEHELKKMLPEENWAQFSHLLIVHGRQQCMAQRPRCLGCVLVDICPKCGVEIK